MDGLEGETLGPRLRFSKVFYTEVIYSVGVISGISTVEELLVGVSGFSSRSYIDKQSILFKSKLDRCGNLIENLYVCIRSVDWVVQKDSFDRSNKKK